MSFASSKAFQGTRPSNHPNGGESAKGSFGFQEEISMAGRC